MALWIPTFAALLILGLLILWAMKGNGVALVTLTSILIVALLTPSLAPVVEAAAAGGEQQGLRKPARGGTNLPV